MSDIESGILSQTSEPQEKPTMYFKAMLGVLSTFCVIINIICMAVATDYIMYVVAIITCFVISLAMKDYNEYIERKAVAATAERLDKGTKQAEEGVNAMGDAINEINETADKIKELEGILQTMSEQQGHSIENLEKQVKANEEILKDMKSNLKNIVIQTILTIIIRNDTDGDFKIDPEELGPMVDDLSNATEEMDGVTFFPERFKSAIANTNGEIADVMKIIKSVGKDGGEDPIFTFSDDAAPRDKEGEETKEDPEEYDPFSSLIAN
uniref:Uncharacterized protein n=1 Tax=Leptocylindrus aporus TaxID=1398097 RepID=A0A7S0KAX8_9STRA|mmetsp:Transcript_1449/g.1971  ORF Transcript_1449/g.1971 Transcript_1449/m.1971 type:complete len:267 (+) Transcript_1449:131-931(+)